MAWAAPNWPSDDPASVALRRRNPRKPWAATKITTRRTDDARSNCSTGDSSSPALLVATVRPIDARTPRAKRDLIGAGVHFVATCDGPFYRGAKDLTVVGGGHSGLEEGLFLSSSPTTSPSCRPCQTDGHKLLQDKVVNHARMSVLLDTSVTSFNANESGSWSRSACPVTEPSRYTRHAGAFISSVSIPIRVSSRTRWTLTRVIYRHRHKFSHERRRSFRGG